jgi:hypothetical protein
VFYFNEVHPSGSGISNLLIQLNWQYWRGFSISNFLNYLNYYVVVIWLYRVV